MTKVYQAVLLEQPTTAKLKKRKPKGITITAFVEKLLAK